MKKDIMKKEIIKSKIKQVHEEALAASKKAVDDYLEKWNKETGGNKYNEPIYCGFGWVSLFNVRSNSNIGKAFQEIGFKRSYQKCLEFWNPSGYPGQSMDVKEESSRAYAKVFQNYGFKAYMSSRAD